MVKFLSRFLATTTLPFGTLASLGPWTADADSLVSLTAPLTVGAAAVVAEGLVGPSDHLHVCTLVLSSSFVKD